MHNDNDPIRWIKPTQIGQIFSNTDLVQQPEPFCRKGMKSGFLLPKRLEHVMIVRFFVFLDQCGKPNITMYTSSVSNRNLKSVRCLSWFVCFCLALAIVADQPNLFGTPSLKSQPAVLPFTSQRRLCQTTSLYLLLPWAAHFSCTTGAFLTSSPSCWLHRASRVLFTACEPVSASTFVPTAPMTSGEKWDRLLHHRCRCPCFEWCPCLCDSLILIILVRCTSRELARFSVSDDLMPFWPTLMHVCDDSVI